ncbi:hypothetical protein LAL4801_05421 [Roseibium aggregatum]|uniref:Uncharacterized protein n=1 Tax=Roseibium aggregatum TaxID=187304 RepID=A0A0M6YD63_9HYPH|nr:hypothetical protein LAL4801_05421 [Roseibium aggregatum]
MTHAAGQKTLKAGDRPKQKPVHTDTNLTDH